MTASLRPSVNLTASRPRHLVGAAEDSPSAGAPMTQNHSATSCASHERSERLGNRPTIGDALEVRIFPLALNCALLPIELIKPVRFPAFLMNDVPVSYTHLTLPTSELV